jgi:GxxExxY protein
LVRAGDETGTGCRICDGLLSVDGQKLQHFPAVIEISVDSWRCSGGIDLAVDPSMNPTNLPHGETTGAIIQAFHETHEELGSGFSEKVSRNALAIVLRSKGLRVGIEVPLEVRFRGHLIGEFSADMVVNEVVLVEIKGGARIEPYAEAQLLNYLKAAGGGVGLVLNFGRTPQHKRLVMGDPLNSLPSLRKAIQGTAGQHQTPASPRPVKPSAERP